jgi:hypothetical protein
MRCLSRRYLAFVRTTTKESLLVTQSLEFLLSTFTIITDELHDTIIFIKLQKIVWLSSIELCHRTDCLNSRFLVQRGRLGGADSLQDSLPCLIFFSNHIESQYN